MTLRHVTITVHQQARKVFEMETNYSQRTCIQEDRTRFLRM